VSVDYFHRDALAAHDRDWAKNADMRINRKLPAPWNGIPVIDPATGTAFARDNDFANTNSVNQWGQWQRGFIQPDMLTFVGSRPTGNVGITTSTTPPAGVATMAADGMFYLWPSPAGVSFKQTALSKNIDNAENATYSNWNQWKMLIPATDRVQFATFADHTNQRPPERVWRSAVLPRLQPDRTRAGRFQEHGRPRYLSARFESVESVRHALLQPDRGGQRRRHAAPRRHARRCLALDRHLAGPKIPRMA